jgi:hypothetical protein
MLLAPHIACIGLWVVEEVHFAIVNSFALLRRQQCTPLVQRPVVFHFDGGSFEKARDPVERKLSDLR